MQDIIRNVEECNPDRKCNVFIILYDMISNKKLNQITELFIRGRKLNMSSVFITQSCFEVPKSVRLNCTRFFCHESSK